jgi:hypothetical protein
VSESRKLLNEWKWLFIKHKQNGPITVVDFGCLFIDRTRLIEGLAPILTKVICSIRIANHIKAKGSSEITMDLDHG